MKSKSFPLAISAVLLASGPVTAATMSFQNGVDGYAGAEDTFINDDGIRNEFNWGAYPELFVGPFAGGPSPDEVGRSLIRFDVDSLAGQYAQITQVRLELTTIQSFDLGGTLELRMVAPENGDWNAGNSQFAVENGSASWDNKAEPGTPWVGGPGLGTTGFGSVLASSSFAPNLTGGLLSLVINDAAAATALIDEFSSGANEGFLIKAVNEAPGTLRGDIKFHSSNVGAGLAPRLIVEYTPIPEPTTALLVFGGLVALAAQRPAARV